MQPNPGDHKVLIVSKEFLDRIMHGLGELQGKFSIAVVFELQRQLEAQEQKPKEFLAELEQHVKSIKERVPPTQPAPELP